MARLLLPISLLVASILVGAAMADLVDVNLKSVDNLYGELKVRRNGSTYSMTRKVTIGDGLEFKARIPNPKIHGRASELLFELSLTPNKDLPDTPIMFNATVHPCNARMTFAFIAPSIRWEMAIMGNRGENETGKVCAEMFDVIKGTPVTNLVSKHNTEFPDAIFATQFPVRPIRTDQNRKFEVKLDDTYSYNTYPDI